MALFNKRVRGGLGKVVETNPTIRPDRPVKAVVDAVKNRNAPMTQVDHRENAAKADAARQTFF
jgi:hypothetical protein